MTRRSASQARRQNRTVGRQVFEAGCEARLTRYPRAACQICLSGSQCPPKRLGPIRLGDAIVIEKIENLTLRFPESAIPRPAVPTLLMRNIADRKRHSERADGLLGFQTRPIIDDHNFTNGACLTNETLECAAKQRRAIERDNNQRTLDFHGEAGSHLALTTPAKIT